VYDTTLGKVVEALKQTRLLVLEDVKSLSGSRVARVIFKTKRQRPMAPGQDLDSRVERVSRSCILTDMLSSNGWELTPASGGLLQERFRNTIFYRFTGVPSLERHGAVVEDPADGARRVVLPCTTDAKGMVKSLPKRFRKFLLRHGKTLELETRGTFSVLKVFSYGRLETRERTALNYLGLLTALEKAGASTLATMNIFGDSVDTVVFRAPTKEDTIRVKSAREAETSWNGQALWGISFQSPSQQAMERSMSIDQAPPSPSSPGNMSANKLSVQTRTEDIHSFFPIEKA